MKRYVILTMCCLFVTSIGLAQQIFTLEKALETAFINSPDLIQSRLTLEQRQLDLVARNAALKSQFTLNVDPFSYIRNNQYDSYNSKWYTNKTVKSSANMGIKQPIKLTDGTISLINVASWQNATNQTSGVENRSFTHDIYLQLEQPIFTYNRTKIELKELEYILENAKLNYALQELSIEQRVTSQFFTVYQQQVNLNVAKEEYNNQKQNYEIIRDKEAVGLVAKEELFQAEINMASSESSVYSAEITYENAKDDFKILLGLPLNEDIAVLPNIDISNVDVKIELATKYALDQRMELRQKEITIEEGLFDIIRAKATNEFEGSISARVGLTALGDKVSNMYDNPTDSEQIGVSLSIPLYDWGSRKATIRSSELALESSKIDLVQEEKDITLNIRQICRNLPILIRQIELNKQKIKNAEFTYDINLEKYRRGDITGMQLQDYQTQLTTTKREHTNAIIDYKLELLNLKIQTLWDFEMNESYLPVDLIK